MKRFLQSLFCLCLVACHDATTSGPAPVPPAVTAAPTEHAAKVTQDRAIPQKAYDLVHYVEQYGHPPRGYVGGRIFENREGRLPGGVEYHEYDVNPKIQGENRGTERVIMGADGSHYYTDDHYHTFHKF